MSLFYVKEKLTAKKKQVTKGPKRQKAARKGREKIISNLKDSFLDK